MNSHNPFSRRTSRDGMGIIVDMKRPRVHSPGFQSAISRVPVAHTTDAYLSLSDADLSAAEREELRQRLTLERAKPPIDAFSMMSALRYLPNRGFPLLLSGLEELRREPDNYRCRQVSVPRDNLTTIPFNQALEFTAKIPEGSWFWGYEFAALTGEVADFRVDVMFNCGDRPLWSQTLDASAMVPTGPFRPVIIEPVLMRGEAELNCRITNMDTANERRGQMLLFFADPCTTVGDWEIEEVLV